MRAVVYERYGPASVLRLGEVPEPAALGRGQVRVAVRRAALNPKDALFRKGRFLLVSGRRFPLRGVHAAFERLESKRTRGRSSSRWADSGDRCGSSPL